MCEIVLCHWRQKIHSKREKSTSIHYFLWSTLVNLRPQFTFIVTFRPFLKLSHWHKFSLLTFVQFALFTNSIKYGWGDLYSNGFDTTAVQHAAFGKQEQIERCRRALLHPLEDMQERLISSLKALQVSKAVLPHKHGVRQESRILQLTIMKLMIIANK